MQANAIKKLVDTYTPEQLAEAEALLLEGELLHIEVEGKDEGEQLTHLSAALWVIHDMNEHQNDFRTSLRNFMAKVRNSIS